MIDILFVVDCKVTCICLFTDETIALCQFTHQQKEVVHQEGSGRETGRNGKDYYGFD